MFATNWLSVRSEGLDGQACEQVSAAEAERFFRIDFELSRTWQLGTGERTTSLTPYIRVLTVLDRRDAIFFHRDAGDGTVEPLATMPLLPFIGLKLRW